MCGGPPLRVSDVSNLLSALFAPPRSLTHCYLQIFCAIFWQQNLIKPVKNNHETMPFNPGESGNPNGRPKGARNKRTTILLPEGDIDPAEHLSSVVSDPKQSPELRASAANMLLPYRYSKLGSAPAPRYVDDPIQVPNFTSIQEAFDFQAEIARRAGAGELELQISQDISNLVKNWVLSVTAQDELQLKIAKENPQGPIEIRVTGGLPTLPGTNINMASEPSINGYTNGEVIDHQEPRALDDSSAASTDRDESSVQEPEPRA
jgi:hypothetical protein